MTDSITPFIMLAIFLVGTLWLGLRYKEGSRNITEYTVGNKMFTTAALVATVVATNYGGGGLIPYGGNDTRPGAVVCHVFNWMDCCALSSMRNDSFSYWYIYRKSYFFQKSYLHG